MSGQVFRYGGDFANMRITRAKGSYIYDEHDRPILDFTSGQMSAILGHSHEEIIEVVRDQIAHLDHLHSTFLSDPALSFAEILTMEQLPVKVTMNEYIESSKYYSTAKSKLFVNGLLDNAVKYFKEEGLIKKVGRGLL